MQGNHAGEGGTAGALEFSVESYVVAHRRGWFQGPVVVSKHGCDWPVLQGTPSLSTVPGDTVHETAGTVQRAIGGAKETPRAVLPDVHPGGAVRG